jgi:hypothetical protein
MGEQAASVGDLRDLEARLAANAADPTTPPKASGTR